MNVIEIAGLRKEYRSIRRRRVVALDGLDLAVPEGGVFGFLGPNGSGKTTTIRCLVGLVRAGSGSCRVFGADVPASLDKVIGRVGAIVETPALFPTFSARLNLVLLAQTYGISRTRVDELLDRVGLASRAGDLVKTYSLGMKQRLAIAAALLKDPALLILDEPANGLDPAGIKEIRELIRGLGAEGRTVFVSSHLLSEVQQMCDRVAILTRGKCIATGPVRDILAGSHARGLIVKLDNLAAGESVLAAAGFTLSAAADALHVAHDPSRASEVTKVLAGAGLFVSELRPDEVDLETVFLELTQEVPE